MGYIINYNMYFLDEYIRLYDYTIYMPPKHHE